MRDHLANERTLLAWARTGVAVMGLGFVVARFGLLIRELGPTLSSHPPTGASSAFGIVLVLIGAMLLLLATVHYVRVGRAIEASDFRWSPKLAFALAGLLVVAGVVLAAYLLVTA